MHITKINKIYYKFQKNFLNTQLTFKKYIYIFMKTFLNLRIVLINSRKYHAKVILNFFLMKNSLCKFKINYFQKFKHVLIKH